MRRDLASIKREVRMAELLLELGWDGDDSGSGGAGGWFSIRCPFHDDRNPSARYNDIRDRFDCYVCDIHGDIFDVVQQWFGYADVRDAREWIESNFLD